MNDGGFHRVESFEALCLLRDWYFSASVSKLLEHADRAYAEGFAAGLVFRIRELYSEDEHLEAPLPAGPE